MASIFDCALLSEDVYEDCLTSRVAGRGWSRVNSFTCGGFYAGLYRKNEESIIAYRGTNDLDDLVADANMIPGMGRIPPSQSSSALRVYEECSQCSVNGIAVVTGHSLGGALAKVVSQRKNVTAIAFNAPFVGDLGGTVPMTSSLISNINAVKDPVSSVTRALGSLPEGSVDQVMVRPPRLWNEVIDNVIGVPVMENLHYHSISTLRRALENKNQYTQSL